MVLAAWSWRPFLPEVTWSRGSARNSPAHGICRLPHSAAGWTSSACSDVCAQFLLYLPLGGLLAVWPLRRGGWLAGPLPAVWLAFVCEASQLGVWERTLDVTIPLMQASGALIGWAIVQRAGYRVYGETWPRSAT